MQEQFTRYYNEELQYLRELGSEFSKAYPKIAGRLGLQDFEVADPYVERLLEGFAFLSARVRLKIDAEFPKFTRHFLDLVYPNYLAPLPSMAIVQLHPEPGEASLAEGVSVARGSVLQSMLGQDEQTRCSYRTAHEVTLWPVELVEARYLESTAALANASLPTSLSSGRKPRAAIRFRLKTTAGQQFSELALDELPLHLVGSGGLPGSLYERIVGHEVGIFVRGGAASSNSGTLARTAKVEQLGFADEEALLPIASNGFSGHRLLQEYAAFPERFSFVSVTGLGETLRTIQSSECEITILLDEQDDSLVDVVSAEHFRLYCTPVINLFEKRTDRINLGAKHFEHLVVPDRTKPLDFEIYEVLGVSGVRNDGEPVQFAPLYAQASTREQDEGSYFVVNREPRNLSAKEKRRGTRLSYTGSEVFVSLVDGDHGQTVHGLRHIDTKALCTNRDLPLRINAGVGNTDFDLAAGGPVTAIRIIGKVTPPRASFGQGETTWRLINALSVNYLTLIGEAGDPRTLRDLLRLFAREGDREYLAQLEGLVQVRSERLLARVPSPGPIAFGRGLKIDLTLDEAAFEGSSGFLLSAVLERFFARSVTLNSFTSTVLHSQQRGEIARWPARIGLRPQI
ncbi:MAG: type VI secretion system baseplate subunit TssF [Pseudomonadales bacterium]